MRQSSRWFGATPILLVLASLAMAQDQGQATGSITGLATLADGKPAPGVTFLLTMSLNDPFQAVQQMMNGEQGARMAKTDGSGRYRFDAVAAGHYVLKPVTGALAETGARIGPRDINVADGATVEGIDFTFVAAGAITGTATTTDGRPMIGAHIGLQIVASTPTGDQSVGLNEAAETDDRGVYRAYGLRAGRYKVSVEEQTPGPGSSAVRSTPQVFYPGTTNNAAAVAVDVGAGSEVGGIDIKVAAEPQGFDVTGRVVDDSGKGVPDVLVLYGIGQPRGSALFGGGGPYTDSKGVFKIERVKPGSYSAVASFADQLDSTMYGDTAKFDVVNGPVSGIELKVHTGITISGTAIVEATDDQQAAARLDEVQLFALSDAHVDSALGFSRTTLGADGSFTIRGLPPGKARIVLGDFLAQGAFEISRVEYNGAPVADGILLSPGQAVSGVRVVLAYANCSVTGQVSVQGGTLPATTQMYVVAHHMNGAGSPANPVGSGETDDADGPAVGRGMSEVDTKGYYRLDHLVPGDYQLSLRAVVYSADGKPGYIGVNQNVTVSSAAAGEVNFVIDLSKDLPKPQSDN